MFVANSEKVSIITETNNTSEHTVTIFIDGYSVLKVCTKKILINGIYV